MAKSKRQATTDIVRTKDRIKKTGEVFTPPALVNEILDKLPPEIWADPSKTILDPTCGDGNFLVEAKKRLLAAGGDERHILDKQIYGVDIMPDNVRACRVRLGLTPDGNDGNIVCADGLRYDFEFVKTDTGYLLNYDPSITAEEEEAKKVSAAKAIKSALKVKSPAPKPDKFAPNPIWAWDDE